MTGSGQDERWFAAFDEAVGSPGPTARLRDVVESLVKSGIAGEVIQDRLESFRTQLQDQGREDDGDAVLDVLDFLTGWCSPQQRIAPPAAGSGQAGLE